MLPTKVPKGVEINRQAVTPSGTHLGGNGVPKVVNTSKETTRSTTTTARTSAEMVSSKSVKLTTPSDSLPAREEIRGLFGAARAVLESKGPLGLFKGLQPRVVAILPGTAVSWSIYEYFKWMLSRRRGGGGVSEKNADQQGSSWA